MRSLDELATHWQKLAAAADDVDTSLDTNGVVKKLGATEASIRKAIAGVDALMAETPPASIDEAAILAAFAWRVHNENDFILTSDGKVSNVRVFDEILARVLSNLVIYLASASKGGRSDLMEAWCVPTKRKSKSVEASVAVGTTLEDRDTKGARATSKMARLKAERQFSKELKAALRKSR